MSQLMCQDAVFVQYPSDISFLSLQGAIATKQSLSEVPQSNYSRLQLRNEIATSSAPRNNRVGVIVH